MTTPAMVVCLAGLAVLAWPVRSCMSGVTVAGADPATWETRHGGAAFRAVSDRRRGPVRRRASGLTVPRVIGRLLWCGPDKRRPAVRARGAALVAAMALSGTCLLVLNVAPWQVLVAGVLIGWTAVVLWRGVRATARTRREEAELANALRAVIRELRAGAAPDEAAAQACADAGPAAGLILAPYARHGPLPPAAAMTEQPATAVPAVVVDQVRRAWAVSAAHGVPLAAVLAACVGDLDDRAALARLRAQHVAGPAMSGYVLAALPVAGIALGAGMGSHPLDILFGGTTGGVLLVVGVGLCCVGLLWSGRIVRGGDRG